MPEPRWVISRWAPAPMAAATTTTAIRWCVAATASFSVDIYVPGCPPTAEALVYRRDAAAEEDPARHRHRTLTGRARPVSAGPSQGGPSPGTAAPPAPPTHIGGFRVDPGPQRTRRACRRRARRGRVGHEVALGQLTVRCPARRDREGADLPARRRELPVLDAGRPDGGRPAGAGRALRVGLQPPEASSRISASGSR